RRDRGQHRKPYPSTAGAGSLSLLVLRHRGHGGDTRAGQRDRRVQDPDGGSRHPILGGDRAHPAVSTILPRSSPRVISANAALASRSVCVEPISGRSAPVAHRSTRRRNSPRDPIVVPAMVTLRKNTRFSWAGGLTPPVAPGT